MRLPQIANKGARVLTRAAGNPKGEMSPKEMLFDPQPTQMPTPMNGWGKGLATLIKEGLRTIGKGFSQRGTVVPGWHGKAVLVPFAVADSRVSDALGNVQ